MMEDLSLHILDMAENAAAAGATRILIAVNENAKRDFLSIRVTDNGRGMSRIEKKKALDPFYTTQPKRTGLGLPLLAQTAGLCGGKMIVDSAPKKGTRVTALFPLGHIDRPPLTKMAETMMMLLFGHPEIGFLYRHTRNGRSFVYSRRGERDRDATIRDIGAVRNSLRSGLRRIGVL